MLSDLFLKTSEQKILGLFARNPGKAFYAREISRLLMISVGAAHQALLVLEKADLLSSQTVGKTKLFRFEAPDPLAKSLRIFITILTLDPLVADLRGAARRIVLYGSYAAGSFSEDSDLDLLVLTSEKETAAQKINAFARKTDLDIRPLIMNQVEWMHLEKTDSVFLGELGHGFVLWEKPVDESGF